MSDDVAIRDWSAPLVSAAWLAEHVDAVRVLDCRVGPDVAAKLASGRVRGAIHVDLDRDLAAPVKDASRGGRHPLPDGAVFAQRVGAWGIEPATYVVVYDDQGGANAAARCWWMLRGIGHSRVAVLDGGFQAALQAGVPLQLVPPSGAPLAPYPATDFGAPIITCEGVDAKRRATSSRVIDVRAAFRYRGDSEPIDPVAGHIPGAINVPFSENLDAGGFFLSVDALRHRYTAIVAGVAPDEVVVHCGSGVTACHTVLAFERAGWSWPAVYVGSWGEWCRRPELPREPAASSA